MLDFLTDQDPGDENPKPMISANYAELRPAMTITGTLHPIPRTPYFTLTQTLGWRPMPNRPPEPPTDY